MNTAQCDRNCRTGYIHGHMHNTTQDFILKSIGKKNITETTLYSDVKGPLTARHSLNEIIPVFIWVTSNYTTSSKPLWPHILALTPRPQKTCAHTHSQMRQHAHTGPLQTLSGCVHDVASPQVFTSTHALHCMHTWLQHKRQYWQESIQCVSILTGHTDPHWYIIC